MFISRPVGWCQSLMIDHRRYFRSRIGSSPYVCYHRLWIMTPDLPHKPEGDGAVFRQLEAVSLTEGVVAALKDAFFSGALKPGAVIVERQIAKQMNVGTPVVREALISLK